MKSNTNAVKAKINQHILNCYSNEFADDGLENLKADVQALSHLPTDYARGKYMAEGGNFLIYYQEQREFLNGLGINPSGKEYPDHKVFEQYCHLIGRQVAELVNTCGICGKHEDSDGRCGCTNKDAN